MLFTKKIFTFAPLLTGEIVFSIGRMAEWSIAAVLKTVDLHGSGGSNPSSSAKNAGFFPAFFFLHSGYRLISGTCPVCPMSIEFRSRTVGLHDIQSLRADIGLLSVNCPITVSVVLNWGRDGQVNVQE